MDPLNVTIVSLLMVLVVLARWVDRHDLVARWFDRVRVRCGTPVPPGRYIVEGHVGIRFGHDESTLILAIPAQAPGKRRPAKYLGMTGGLTRITVEQEDVGPDALLAAYDDTLGPMTIVVNETGRIAQLGIARRAGG